MRTTIAGVSAAFWRLIAGLVVRLALHSGLDPPPADRAGTPAGCVLAGKTYAYDAV